MDGRNSSSGTRHGSQSRSRLTRIGAVAAACLAPLMVVDTTSAQWVQLSDGLSFSDVGGFQLHSSEKWAVYTHDAEVDGAVELWSAPTWGGPPRRLCRPLSAGQAVLDFEIVDFFAKVIYLSPEETPGVFELFVVPVEGGVSQKLSAPMVAGGDVVEMGPIASGGTILYRADQEVDERIELYSVSISGSAAPVKRSAPIGVAGGDVVAFANNLIGTRVLYLVDGRFDDVFELYSFDLTGPPGAAVRLSGTLPAGGDVLDFALSPDNLNAIYRADQDTDGVIELYRASASGPPSVKLNGALPAGGDVYDFAVSPNSQRVVYRADGQTDGVVELWSVPITGGSPVKLNSSLVSGGDVAAFAISADSQRVVYLADGQSDEVRELYSVPIAGGAAIKLNPTPVAGGDVFDFAISPENDWVVYRGDQLLDGFPMGFRVPIAGPSTAAETIWLRAVATAWRIDAPRGRVVVLGSEAFVDGIVRPWSFPLDGTPDPNGGTELVPAADFDPNGDADAMVLGPGGAILYRADQSTDLQLDLYAISSFVFWDDFESGDTSNWLGTP